MGDSKNQFGKAGDTCLLCHNLEHVVIQGLRKIEQRLEVRNMNHMMDTPSEVEFDDQLRWCSRLGKTCFAETRETNL